MMTSRTYIINHHLQCGKPCHAIPRNLSDPLNVEQREVCAPLATSKSACRRQRRRRVESADWELGGRGRSVGEMVGFVGKR